jgi:type II secretory pathway pseudopilin PulG
MSRQTVLSNRRGFALEATLFVLLLLAVLCVFAVSGVTSATRTANYDYRNTRTEYAAEAASDDIMQQLGGMVDDGFISQSELDSLVRPSIPGFSIPTMTVLPNGGATQETVNDGSYAGLYALVRNYDITTRASDSSGNASQAVVTVKAAAIPIFQFGVFYEKDLEITNGQRLDMAGWVHTNGDLFTRSGGGLYLHNIVTTPNKFHFRRKDGSNPGGSDQVYIDDAGGTARQVNNDTEGLPSFPAFRSWSDLRFSGRLKTNAYSVDSLRLPLPAGMPAVELIRHRNASGTDSPEAQAAKFAWKADYYIDIDYTGLNNVCNPGVMTITRAGGRVSPTQAECALIFTGLQDAWWESREQTFVDKLDIDLGALFAWMGTDLTRKSSLMYITFHNVPTALETIATGRGCNGCTFKAYPMVRIKNAATLAAPITIGTDYGLYVQGSYNAIGWQPSALVGDAFTWLSTGFSDATQADRPTTNAIVGGVQRWTRTSPATAPGIIYAAILAGHSGTPFDWMVGGTQPAGCNYTGTGSQSYFYGGGLENFPRFLEDWGGVTTTYRGSLVSVSFSEKATNYCAWAGAYYGVPTRDWAFETRFSDPANLPPGTPVVGSVVQTAFRPVYQ